MHLRVQDTEFYRDKRPPVSEKFRHILPEKLFIANEEFKSMIAMGIYRPSKNPWESPLQLVKKKKLDQWRPCGSYKHLDGITIEDCYPITYI